MISTVSELARLPGGVMNRQTFAHAWCVGGGQLARKSSGRTLLTGRRMSLSTQRGAACKPPMLLCSALGKSSVLNLRQTTSDE